MPQLEKFQKQIGDGSRRAPFLAATEGVRDGFLVPVHSVRVREGVHHRPREPSAHPDHGPERLAHVPVVVDAPLTAGHPTPFLPLIINLAYLRDEVRALVVARGIVLADAGDGVRGGAEVEDLLPIAREDDVLLDVPREVKRGIGEPSRKHERGAAVARLAVAVEARGEFRGDVGLRNEDGAVGVGSGGVAAVEHRDAVVGDAGRGEVHGRDQAAATRGEGPAVAGGDEDHRDAGGGGVGVGGVRVGGGGGERRRDRQHGERRRAPGVPRRTGAHRRGRRISFGTANATRSALRSRTRESRDGTHAIRFEGRRAVCADGRGPKGPRRDAIERPRECAGDGSASAKCRCRRGSRRTELFNIRPNRDPVVVTRADHGPSSVTWRARGCDVAHAEPFEARDHQAPLAPVHHARGRRGRSRQGARVRATSDRALRRPARSQPRITVSPARGSLRGPARATTASKTARRLPEPFVEVLPPTRPRFPSVRRDRPCPYPPRRKR